MKEYHPPYQELDHTHSFSQCRDILTSALVLNDIPEMGLDYHDLITHKTMDNERLVNWPEKVLDSFFLLFLRSDYDERELQSQYFQSYEEMNDLSYNYRNYLYLQQQQQQQDMNNNQSKLARYFLICKDN